MKSNDRPKAAATNKVDNPNHSLIVAAIVAAAPPMSAHTAARVALLVSRK